MVWCFMTHSRNTYQFARSRNTNPPHNLYSIYLYNHYHATRYTLHATPVMLIFLTMAQQPLQWARASSLSRIHDHTQTHHTRYKSSGRVISPSQRPLPDNTQHSRHTSTPPAGFEPTIPARELQQDHALDRAINGSNALTFTNIFFPISFRLTLHSS